MITILTSENMATIPECEPFVQPLNLDWYQGCVEAISMLRLDVIHPVVSGNKWYKLQYYLQEAQQNQAIGILTFGGAYSNHLVAAAAAAKTFGLNAIGIVRGLHAADSLTPTLKDCVSFGMQLVFVTKEEYDRKYDADYQATLNEKYKGYYIIDEGGAGAFGVKGSETIASYIPDGYTHICLSSGTGTTLCGTRRVLKDGVNVLGYVPMKGGRYISKDIDSYLPAHLLSSYTLFDNWHFGGFGKQNDELVDFMNAFYATNNIPLDMVYTGKMMFGIQQQLAAGYFPKNARLLCIHTGGLQGNSTIKDKLIY